MPNSSVRLDDQHVVAKIFGVFLDDRVALARRTCTSAWAVLRLATVSSLLVERFRVGSVDLAHGGRHFAQIAQEDVAALPLLLHLLPPADVHRQLAADGLQAQPQFLLNLRIRGDRFLRFAGERHPHAGHVDHDRHRPAGQLSRAIGSARRSASWCPSSICVIAQAPVLKLQRHAIGIPQHVHRLALFQVDAAHGLVQLGDLGRS